ncbi:glutactin, partial [Frankliniella occidentalis]|uniref:Glutactin n=1 Tax=Frankliniella occidentalis TaxID=133901 RepID=A0A9C6XTH8_FRAOC
PRPIEQHDAQTFVRRPAEGAPSQTIPFSKVNPVPTRASAQEEQENLRFDQENLRIQQAQQAQVDSLRLQQAQSAEQFDQQNRSILKSQRSRQENLRFQDNLQQQQQQQQHQLQLQQQQQQQQQQLFEQQNTRALQSQQVRQENLRTQDNFQQQQPQQQQVAPQFQAQPEDPASGLFDVVPVNTPAPAARAAAHKVHRGRARHQEEPEQQVGRARQHSRRLPIAAAVAPTVAPAATPAAFGATPIRVADDDARTGSLSEEQEAREQAENAHYTFASAIDDKLTDNAQVRQETRDGLNLAGLYSYSDGFFRRTVHYEADENGYRVTKEEVEPLGDGPQPDPAGTADVRAQISGTDFGYRITADDIREKTKEPVKEAVAAVEPQQHRFAPRGERV